MSRLKRILSLILVFTMVFTMLPSSLAESLGSFVSDDIITYNGGSDDEEGIAPQSDDDGGEETPADTGDDEEEADTRTPQEVFAQKSNFIEVYLHPCADKTGDEISSELIGDQFQYIGYVRFDKQVNYTGYNEQFGYTGPLFTQYEDVVVYIKAPEGIVFTDAEGNALALETEGDYAGYYKYELGTVDAPVSAFTQKTINGIYAYMPGNGTKGTTTFAPVDVKVVAHANVLSSYDAENHDQYTDTAFTSANITDSTGSSGIIGEGTGAWTYNKYNNTSSTGDAVKEDGDYILITTYITAGRDVDGNVSNQDSDYVRYGMVDVAALTITDAIQSVTGVSGNVNWPESVTVTYSDGSAIESGASYDASTHTVTITADSLKTIDASAVGAGTVKRGTVYKIVAKYAKADFIYPVGTIAGDDKNFIFSDAANMTYTLKDGSTTPQTEETASAKWYDIAAGGDVGVQAHIFLNETTKTSENYTVFYSDVSDFGTISYKLYQADDDGNPIKGEGAWTATIDMAVKNNSSGYTGSDLYTDAATKLKGLIPEGNIVIEVDTSNLDTNLVKLVNANNEEITNSPIPVSVVAGKLTKTDVYLRYINGGLVHVNKVFYNIDGTQVKDENKLKALYAATTFTFKNNTTNKEYSLSLDTVGTGVIALPAGTYTVTETSPDGYIAYVSSGFTVNANDELYLPGTSTKSDLINYPDSATISVKSWSVDYFTTEAEPTLNKVSYSASGVTYRVEQRVEGTEDWSTFKKGNSTNTTVNVPRFDADGNVYEYRVVAVNQTAADKAYAGIVNDGTVSDGVESTVFDFEDDPTASDPLVENVDLYFINTITINVTKTINKDYRDTAYKATKDGWKIVLTSSDGTVYEPQTTGTDGKVTFGPLPKTDKDGKYITYTITEDLSERADKDLWKTTYNDNNNTTPATVAVTKSTTTASVNVFNTLQQAHFDVMKVDAASSSTAVANTTYTFYTYGDDGTTKLWLTAELDEFGFRKLSDDESKAAQYTTGTDGKTASVNNVRTGMILVAHEVAANKDYYINEKDIVLTNKSTAAVPCTQTEYSKGEPFSYSTTYYLADVKHPSLTVSKAVVNQQTGKVISASESEWSKIKGAKASFDLYIAATTDEQKADAAAVKVSDDLYLIPAKDADGKAIKFDLTASSSSFKSAAQLLASAGDYYLLETSVSEKVLVLPKTASDMPSQVKDKYVTAENGKLFYGPVTVEANKTYTATITAYDYYNSSSVSVEKYDSYTNERVYKEGTKSLAGTNMKYVLAVKVPSTDTTLITNLTAAGYTTNCPVTDFTESAGDGNVWYYSGASSDSTADGCTVLLRDSSNNILEYWLIETQAPDGYSKSVNANGSESTVYVKCDYDAATSTYTAKLSNPPKGELIIDKTLIDVWNQVSGLAAYYQAGIPVAFYAVDKTTGVLTYIGSVTTNGMGVADLTSAAIDFNKYDYLAVETCSNGYDYKNPSDSGDYRVASFDAASYTGLKVSDLPATNTKTFVKSDAKLTKGATTADDRYVAESSFYNYNPYIQIQFNKIGLKYTGTDADGNPTWATTGSGLARSKFYLYKVTEKQWTDALAANSNDKEKAARSLCVAANTDYYVYETDENGHFYTVAEDYYDRYVYIFQEFEATDGYYLNDTPVVVTFDDYKDSKNGIYDDMNPLANKQVPPGPGDAFYRYFRIALDKYSDRDADKVYSTGDTKLADVTFYTYLVDADKNVVKSDAFETFFTTGTDEKDPSYVISETMKITKATLAAIAAELDDASDMDDIFTFYNGTEVITYEQFLALTSTANVSVEFTMLIEETKWPELTTPFELKYYTTIKTGTSGVYIDKTWTDGDGKNIDDGKYNPIMNAWGNKVFTQILKYDETGARWTPSDKIADDYVEVTIYEKSKVGVEAEAVVRIDASNYNLQKITALEPETTYVAVETHSPYGYDKPTNNYVEFKTGSITTIVDDDPDVRIQKVSVKNTPYVDIVVTKLDSSKNPVSGVTLALTYSDGKTVYGANFEANDAAMTVKGTTDANGQVKFTVPLYNYTTSKDGKNQRYAVASYKVNEYDADGKLVSGFAIINNAAGKETITLKDDSWKSTVNASVINPETTDLTVTKLGISDEEAALPGVQFKLEYVAATSAALKSATVPAAPTSGWTTKENSVVTDENGQYTFKGLSSGWYRLTETIPEHYVYGGKTYTITFMLVTPGDAANLTRMGLTGKYWSKANVTLLSNVVSDVKSQTYCTVAVDATGVGLTVKNTAMAHLKVSKLFVTDSTITVPSTITIDIYRKTQSTPVKTITLNITDKQGVTEDIELEPGYYAIIESIAVDTTAAYTSYWSSETVTKTTAVASAEGEVTEGKYVAGTTDFITLTCKDTAEAGSNVAFTNYSTRMEVKATKVDNDGNKLVGCEFVIYETKDGLTYYYKGQDATTGYGVWTTAENEAMHFTTTEGGQLDCVFYADLAHATVADGKVSDTYYLREVKADIATRKLMADKQFSASADEILTLSENLVNYSGLSIDLTLIGHTEENAAKHEDPTKVKGAVFELYKVKKGSEPVLVTSYDEDGNPMSSVTTDENGQGSFNYLDLLEDGESYVLIQKTTTDDYWTTSTYFNTDKDDGTETLTVGGKTYQAVTLIKSSDQLENASVEVTVYNMPVSGLLILKYDYEKPKAEPPVGATFEAVLDEGTSAYTTDATYQANVALNNQDYKVTEAAKAAVSDRYSYIDAAGAFSSDTANYSYGYIVKVFPGTYTVTETARPDGYMYDPQDTTKDDPWYTIKENIVVGDDGGVTVVEFANLPNPGANELSIKKEAIATDGTGEDGALGNLQVTKDDGTWQSVTYKISDFAPAVIEGEDPREYVEYAMKSLYLDDFGQSFYADTSMKEAVTDVKSYVKSVTVGVANYAGDLIANSMPVGVWGIDADGNETHIKNVDVANGAQTVTFASKTYVSFRIVYNADAEGNAQAIGRHFYAEPVTCVFEMKQVDDNDESKLVRKIKNEVQVTMGYNIGTATDSTVSKADTETVPATPDTKLPEADVTKKVSINTDPTLLPVKDADGGTVTVHGDDTVKYTLTFKNTDDPTKSTASIPTPFIADELPDCIDIITEGDVSPFTVTAYRADGKTTFDIDANDVVYDKDGRYVYVTANGSLAPGESMVLTITGNINTARAMEENSKGIVNTAFGGSTTMMPKNQSNKTGAAFNVNGVPAAAHSSIEALKEYAATKATLSHKLSTDTDITIIKEVAGTITDKGYTGHNYMSGKANVAITESEGDVFYRVTVTSTDAIAKGGLRIADILPFGKDYGIDGDSRASGFATLKPTEVVVTVGGEQLSSSEYEIHYTDSTKPAVYKTALTSGNFSSFNKSADEAYGWIIQINKSITKSQAVVITFTCKAPAAVTKDATGKVISSNLYKCAVNSASCWTVNDKTHVTTSNLVYVTLEPDDSILYHAAIGDRIWIDTNANGIQDEGEPDYTASSLNLYLRTFNKSNKTYTTKAVKIGDGWYAFHNLNTALPQQATGAYDSDYNADYQKITGDAVRYTYQVAVGELPDGYIATESYATNGDPTTFAVATDEETGLLIYSDNASDGHEVDSDFVYDETTGQYVTRRVYLPIQKVQLDKPATEAEYMSFDLGLIRIRDLTLTKLGDNNKVVSGVSFEIYGPFYTEPTSVSEATSDKLFTTITTDENGVATFTSDESSYLNYYAYYIIKETGVKAPYAAKIVSLSSAESSATQLKDADDAFVLAPCTTETGRGEDDIIVTDLYIAKGEITIPGEKILEGADITAEPYNDMFTFEFTANEDGNNKTPNSSTTLVNEGAKIGVKNAETGKVEDLKLSFEVDGWLRNNTLTYTYTIKETDPSVKGMTADETTWTLTLTITDPEADGELKIVSELRKGDTVVDTSKGIQVSFTNTLDRGGLDIVKAVDGTENAKLNGKYKVTAVLTYDESLADEIDTSAAGTAPTVTGGSDVTKSLDGNVLTISAYIAKDEHLTITEVPVDTTYTVSEEDYTEYGYATEWSATSGTIKKDVNEEVADKLTVTNERYVGELDVTKLLTENTTENPDLNGEYEVTVELTYDAKYSLDEDKGNRPAISGAAEEATVTAEGNVLTIVAMIKADATLKLTGIPTGTSYTVTEKDYTDEGYVVADYAGDVGEKIETGATKTVTITNEREVGKLTVEKKTTETTTENAKLKDIGYVFTTVFTYADDVDLTKDSNLPVLKGAKITADDTKHQVTVVATIKNGESFEITNVIKGTTYTITETDYYEYGYKKLDAQEGKISDVTAEYKYTFTNERYVGELDVTKLLTENTKENPDLNGEYEVTVKLTYDSKYSLEEDKGNRPAITGAEGEADVSASGNELTVVAKIKADGTLKLTGIPTGTSYTVEEKDYTLEGYVDAVYAGNIGEAIETNAIKSVTITNERELGSLKVTKAITETTTENTELKDVGYVFTTVFTYDSKIDVTKTSNKPILSGATGTVAPDADNHTITVTATIKKGESFVIDNVIKDTTYTIEETDYYEYGYKKLDAQNGTISDVTAEYEYTFTNERYVGELDVTKLLTENTKENPDLNGEYEVTVKLTYDEDYSLDHAKGNWPTVEGAAEKEDITYSGNLLTVVAKVATNGTLKLTGIPTGITYTVEEKDYTDLGYVVAVYDGEVGTIETNVIKTTTITNERELGSLKVTKAITDETTENTELAEVGYEFTTVFTYDSNVDVTNENNKPVIDVEGATVTPNAEEHNVTVVATIKNGESFEITNVLKGTTYTISETDYHEYGYTVLEAQYGEIEDVENEYEYTFTNERLVGEIDITKELAGTGTETIQDMEFEFTVVIDVPATYSLADDHGNIPIPDHDATVDVDTESNTVTIVGLIKGGEVLTITNVLVGSSYTATEANYYEQGILKTTVDGTEIDTRVEGAELTSVKSIDEVGTVTSEFINERNSYPLTVSKVLAGNATDSEKEFTFTLTLSREDITPIDGEYTYTVTTVPEEGEPIVSEPQTLTVIAVEGEAAGMTVIGQFTLKGGQYITIYDILADTKYLVVEDDYTLEGYITEGNEATDVPTEASEVTVTNNRNIGNIDVSKILAGNATDDTKLFTFTVVLTRTDDLPVAATYETLTGPSADIAAGKYDTATAGTLTFTETDERSATATFTLLGGQTMHIMGIYADTTYTVTEAGYWADGYTTAFTGDTGAVAIDVDALAAFTNTRNTGNLSITKEVVAIGMGIPTEQEFTFTVTLTPANGVAINGAYRTVDQDNTVGTIVFTNNVATLTLRHNESITIYGILSGSGYSVTETATAGYTSQINNATGTIGIGTTVTVEAINTVRQVYRDLTLQKEWDDNDNAENARTASVTVTVSTQQGTVGTYTLSEDNDWTVTITNLPRYSNNGTLLSYKVTEDAVQYYKITYEGRPNESVVIIKNTYSRDYWDIPNPPVPLAGDLNLNEGYCFN